MTLFTNLPGQQPALEMTDKVTAYTPTPPPPNPGRPHPGFVRFRALGSLELLLEHIALLIFCPFREMANLNCTYYTYYLKKEENNLVKLQKLSSTKKRYKIIMFKSNLCLCVTLIPKPLSHACANFLGISNQLKFKKQKTQLPALICDWIKLKFVFLWLPLLFLTRSMWLLDINKLIQVKLLQRIP